MNKFVGLVIAVAILLGVVAAASLDSVSSKHEVTFYTPANITGKHERNVIFELSSRDQQVDASRYYMDVSSVYCAEAVCKVDSVRLFWDELGRYTKLSLNPGVKLEKGDAEDFEQEDYQKLDRILSNRNSDLASLHKNELVAPESGGNSVDALTGATVAIRKTDYIKGAIWTCYTLWHFTNGEVVNIIRNISGAGKSIEELRALLSNSDINYQLFALQQLTKRKDITENTLSVIVSKLEQGDNVYFNDAIAYLNILPDKEYKALSKQFLFINNSELRALVLENLANTSRPLDTEVYSTIAKGLGEWQQYQLVSQFLTVLEKKEISHQKINEALSDLLLHENFIIARRVYWHLRQQPTDMVNIVLLDDFFLQHQMRL